jgi:hypothetical protein
MPALLGGRIVVAKPRIRRGVKKHALFDIVNMLDPTPRAKPRGRLSLALLQTWMLWRGAGLDRRASCERSPVRQQQQVSRSTLNRRRSTQCASVCFARVTICAGLTYRSAMISQITVTAM